VLGRARPAVRTILDRALAGAEIDVVEGETLLGLDGADTTALVRVADAVRAADVGDDVTYVVNRNINFTNVCFVNCHFCAFKRQRWEEDAYNHGMDVVLGKVEEAIARGATEVCMQGGINPDMAPFTYRDVLVGIKTRFPQIHVHAFSPMEIMYGARRTNMDYPAYIGMLRDCGLGSIPGTAAEILDDDVRAILCPDKINTEEWLEAHRTAHSVGLRSNVTMMFGAVESPRSWARHLVVTRDLQRETGGFTEFVGLPFVHMAAPIYLQRRARRGPTFRETLLVHAVARIAYGAAIPNVQVSWVKVGGNGARQLLQSGCNDLGGTLMDENISRAAGATHGQAMDEAGFEAITGPLGRPLAQRSTLYGAVEPRAAATAATSSSGR
jgi:FO synthase